MRTVVVIQARTGSTRLPRKVLEPLAGEPMLARVVARSARASSVDAVAVATTDLPDDDAIAALGDDRGWTVVRGSEHDLTARYVQAARETDADIVVRVTSDCPLIEPDVIDRVVNALQADPEADNATNVLPVHTWPRGLDVEAIRREALDRVDRLDTDPAWREHATYYIRQHPEQFRTVQVHNPDHPAPNTRRWTVDTSEDLALAQVLYDHFGHDRFSYDDVLAALAAHPGWEALNAHIEQKPVQSAAEG